MNLDPLPHHIARRALDESRQLRAERDDLLTALQECLARHMDGALSNEEVLRLNVRTLCDAIGKAKVQS